MIAVDLRTARPADTRTVAAIWAAGWRDGHLGHVPEALHAARTPESFVTRTADRMGDGTTVALVNGEIAGFVMVVADCVDQVYVAAGHRGTGLAATLLDAAEDLVRTGGHPRAWLAVVPGNARARRFYERRGWRDDGPFDLEAAGIAVPCRRYLKDL